MTRRPAGSCFNGLLDLLPDHSAVRDAHAAMLSDTCTQALLERLPDWEANMALSVHNSPGFAPLVAARRDKCQRRVAARRSSGWIYTSPASIQSRRHGDGQRRRPQIDTWVRPASTLQPNPIRDGDRSPQHFIVLPLTCRNMDLRFTASDSSL
jgi:hypothetical protein